MIKRIPVLLLAILLPFTSAMAQDVVKEKNDKKDEKVVKKLARDFLMLEFMYCGWLNTPDSINTSGIGRGFNVYLCYDFPFKNSSFSFAGGIGIGTDNIYLGGNQEIMLNGTDSLTSQAIFQPESRTYKKYKLTTTYLEAPFELRYFGNKYNRNRGFKAAIGLRVGTLIGAHTKGKEEGTKIVYKVGTKNYLETWRFAATARVGWGNFTIKGTYNLTNLYKENLGPPITPYSIGLCITGL